jgi:hypothetical protein
MVQKSRIKSLIGGSIGFAGKATFAVYAISMLSSESARFTDSGD